MTNFECNRRKVVISILFGLAGFGINLLDLKFFEYSPLKISIIPGLIFPLLVTLAWGWKFGLLSALAGGCQSMWFIWADHGWGVIYSVPVFTLWITWHGWWADRNRGRSGWMRSKILMEIPFRIMTVTGFYTLFPLLLKFNPPPWSPASTQGAVPAEWLNLFAVKNIISACVLLQAANLLLNLGLFRRLFGLPPRRAQRDTGRIYAGAFLIGLSLWLLDSAFDYLLFDHGKAFWEIAVADVDSHEKFMRLLYFIIPLSGAGVIVYINRRRTAMRERLHHLNRVLAAIRNVNQLITHQKDRESLIREVCRILVETRGFLNAWIVLRKEHGPVEGIYHSGFGDDFSVMAEQVESGIIPGCADKAIRRGSVTVIDDTFSECPECPLSPEYEGSSGISVRLEHRDTIYGWISLSMPKEYADDREEHDLLNELAGDIAYALWSIEMETRRDSLESKYSKVLSTTTDAIIAVNREGSITLFNPGAERLFECSAEDAMGREIFDFCPGDLREEQAGVIRRALEEGEVPHYQTEVLTADGRRVPVEMTIAVRIDDRGSPAGINAIIRDISERLDQDREYNWIIKTTTDSFWSVDRSGFIRKVNPAGALMLGYAMDELTGMHVSDIDIDESTEDSKRRIEKAIEEGSILFEAKHLRKDGSIIDVEVSSSYIPGPKGHFVTFIRDITGRKQVESEREITLDLLRQLNSPNNLHELMTEITLLMRDWSDCEAVGIRLRKDEDYPYFETRGFPAEFVKLETNLCAVDEEGELLRDDVGNPVLECMCGNVLRGRFDPSLPFFTERGTFWTNSTKDLLASTSEEDRQARTRNRCNGEGYESVALVPLRYGDEVLGLLQFNDSLRDRFDRSKIELFERFADNLAVGIAQRRSAKELEVNKNMLAEAERIAHFGGWEWDIVEGRFILSDEWLRIHGCRTSPLSMDELIPIAHPGDIPAVQKAFQDSLEGTKLYDLEHRIIRQHDGEIRHIHAHGEVMRDERGRAVKMYGVARDVTESRKAEKALRESEGRYKRLIDNSPDITYVYSTRYGASFWSDRVQDVLGFDPGQMKEDPFIWHDSIHPEDLPLVNRALESGETFDLEYRIRDSRGRWHWIQDRCFSIREVEGDTVIEGLAVDITERKKAEQALRESERQKEVILNSTAEMVAYYNTELQVIWANRTSAESVGRTAEEVIGEHCYEIWHGRREPCEDCPVIKARDSGVPHESVQQTPNGRYFYLRGYPIFNDQEEVVALVEFGQDITEKKEAEQEQERLEEQLNQAQKMESVGRLAGGVAHDFNNMLSVILGHARMALDKTDPYDPLSESLREIINAGERSANLTRQMLAFARRQTITPKVLDLNKTIEGMLDMIRRLIGEDIDLIWQPNQEVWPVRIDPAQIDQLLINLCVNARESIEDIGTIRIETGNVGLNEPFRISHSEFTPGEYIRLAVIDDGCGMDRETLEKAFEPFFTTKGESKGTGLGLSTVYGIVKQNDGLINVRSEPGKGSTIEIYFPRQISGQMEVEEKQAEQEVLQGKETILLVEDEKALLELCERMLETLGYRTFSAPFPGAAIDMAERFEGEIDILMTDVIMPEMNGLDLAEKLKELYPDIKCLFISGYTDNVIRKHKMQSRGFHFLQKPFSMKELSRRLRETIGMKKLENEGLID